ncbi:MAG: ATP phosphoribosyltransferase regulatory subunit [Nanoarchaeota archaeon]
MEIIKGFRDIEDAGKKTVIRNIIEDIFSLYNYNPAETPIIENEDFVKGNNLNDEAVSSIFKLQDRGKRNLALRYEFTFQLKRLANNKKLPYKRYQIGEVFRDEPTTGNRWREFTQCDVDVVGSDVKYEAEILKISSMILKKLGIKFKINFNNRKLLNEIIDDYNIKEVYRNEVIKEIDKLDKLSEKEVKENLKKYGAEKILGIFNKKEKYFEKYENYNEIKELKKICSFYKVKINFQPFLARGLSYYNGSIFEIKSDKIKETITAGGSYLVNGIQSTGISFGLDRLESLAEIDFRKKKVLVISLNQDKKAFEISEKVRESGLGCSIFYGKPGKALDYANTYKINYVIFVGDNEIKNKKINVKDMESGEEVQILVNSIEKYFKKTG